MKWVVNIGNRLKVKNDFIFKRIFGQDENKEILISFLNAVLELEPGSNKMLDNLKIIVGVNLKKDGLDDKLGILDIMAKTIDGEQINIEIQLINQYNMDKRTLFYWSKLYTDQLKQGQAFNVIKKTITINILNFDYIDIESYYSVFHLWEDKNKDCQLTDMLEIRFIELPKFRRAKADLSRQLDRWLLFIDSSEGESDMVKNADPIIRKAEEILELLGSSDEVKRYYDAREKAIHDEITRTLGAREEGMEIGLAKGLAKGLEKGLEKGKEIEKIAIARNLIDILDDDVIASKIGLSIDEVKKLRLQ